MAIKKKMPDEPSFNKAATAKPIIGDAPTAPIFNTTATAKPTLKPLPGAPVYDTSSWDESAKGQAALGDYNAAKDKVNNYGDFTYDDYVMGKDAQGAKDALDVHNASKPGAYQSQWQQQLDALMNSIMNRDKFSYDMNGDALYQQYKDKFTQQGKMAMADTMGQAAAMTGGYGNSYAQSVGQQAYQGQLQNLNDVVPELYQMALDRYNREGQDLYNQYGLVMDRENTDYGRYRDSVADWESERGYLAGRYDTERGFDYGRYVDDRNLAHATHQEGYQRLLDALGIAKGDYYDGANMFYNEQANRNSIEGQKFSDAMSLWGAENDQAWKQYQADEEARQYANSLLQQGYQNEFGKWEADANNAWREYDADEAARKDANALLQQNYQNQFGAWEAENNEAWKQKEYDYRTGRDAVEDQRWQQQFDESKRQYNEQFGYQQAQDALSQENWEKQFGYQQSQDKISQENWLKNYGLSERELAMKEEAWDIEKQEAGYGNNETSGDNVVDDDFVDPTDTSGITDSMREKAATFTDNESLASWAYGLADSGAISEEEADHIIAENMDQNEKYIETEDESGNKTKKLSFSDMVKSTKGWSVESKGGANLFGIDKNAKVVAPNGEIIRLDQLRERLVSEGMKKSEATKFIKDLQQNLGISSNWLFGW